MSMRFGLAEINIGAVWEFISGTPYKLFADLPVE
jgi:hypothetical protein